MGRWPVWIELWVLAQKLIIFIGVDPDSTWRVCPRVYLGRGLVLIWTSMKGTHPERMVVVGVVLLYPSVGKRHDGGRLRNTEMLYLINPVATINGNPLSTA